MITLLLRYTSSLYLSSKKREKDWSRFVSFTAVEFISLIQHIWTDFLLPWLTVPRPAQESVCRVLL